MKGCAALHKAPHELLPGEWTEVEGDYYACCPDGSLANLSLHQIVITEGVISVSPSILTSDGQGQRWHGYLTRGEWHEV